MEPSSRASERPPSPRRRAAAAAVLLLVLGAVSYLLLRPEPEAGPSADAMGMPEAAGGSFASRRKAGQLFGGSEGASIFSDAAAGDFFRRAVAALLPSASDDARARFLLALLADPEARRHYEAYLRAGGRDPEGFADHLKRAGVYDRLMAKLNPENPGAARMLVRDDGKAVQEGAGGASEPARLDRPRPSSRADFEAMGHIFSMMPAPSRSRVLERLEEGYGVWDACARAGLTADCNAAVAQCRQDAGCASWLRGRGQEILSGAGAAAGASDRKRIALRSPAAASDPGPPGGPEAGPGDGGGWGEDPGGSDSGGGDSGGGDSGGADSGGGDSGSTGERSRAEICAETPWKPFCPGAGQYEEAPTGDPPPPPPPAGPPPAPPPPSGPDCSNVAHPIGKAVCCRAANARGC